jgi:hypothetical protein
MGLGSVGDDDELEGLALVWALRLFVVERLYGVTAWTSQALPLLARLAPLSVVTACTPAHGDLRALTWSCPIDEARLERVLLPSEPAPASPAAAIDDEALRGLQDRLEAGAQVELLAAARAGKAVNAWLSERLT